VAHSSVNGVGHPAINKILLSIIHAIFLRISEIGDYDRCSESIIDKRERDYV
jgi:hypothetical protein